MSSLKSMQGAFNQVNTVVYICLVKKTTSTVTKHNDADQDSTFSRHVTINTKVETVSLVSVE